MVTLNPQIIEKNGKKEYAVLSYDEFLKVQEELLDYEDLRCLREAKRAEGKAPTVSLEVVKRRIGGQRGRSKGRLRRRG